MTLQLPLRIVCSAVALALAALAVAQTPIISAPAGLPTTGTTVPFVPHVAVVPPGMQATTIGSYSFYCQAGDESWLKQAVSAARPSSRPSTMPADLIAYVKQHRAELVHQIATEMALPDEKAIDQAVDNKLLLALQQLQDLRPAIIFMPLTPQKLTDIMKAGWRDPRYLFFQGEGVYKGEITLTDDYKMHDLVIYVPLDPADTPDDRVIKVSEAIDRFNQLYYTNISYYGQDPVLRQVFIEILMTNAIEPLKLPPNLQWFGRGVASIFACRYAAKVSGASPTMMLLESTLDDPRNPIRSQPLDLVHPNAKEQVRPEIWPLYQDAMNRKGASIVNEWMMKGGGDVVAKVMPLLREKHPTDAAALAAIINQATNFDISQLLPPNYKVILLPSDK